MSWKKKIFIISSGILLVLIIWAVSHPKEVLLTFVDLGGLEKGDPFPELTGLEENGEPFDFNEYNGKTFIAMIAKIDCEVCKSSYPTLEKWDEEYPDIPFFMVGKGEPGEYSQTKEDHKFTFPILITDQKVEENLKIKVFPVFYIVNSSGIVEDLMVGFDQKEFSKLIDQTRSLK